MATCGDWYGMAMSSPSFLSRGRQGMARGKDGRGEVMFFDHAEVKWGTKSLFTNSVLCLV